AVLPPPRVIQVSARRQISRGKEPIREFGIYKADEVLVLGLRLAPRAQYDALIFQIDTERADQRRDVWGMHSEVNCKACYGLVTNSSFDSHRRLLMIDLAEQSTGDVQRLSFELSSFLKDCDSRLIIEMEHIFQTYEL